MGQHQLSGFHYRLPETKTEETEPSDPIASIGLVVGKSPAMSEVALQMRRVAASPDTTVLLQGETGTGKEVFARAIHALSRRAAYQFVDMNCAAVPPTLLQTQLFCLQPRSFPHPNPSP